MADDEEEVKNLIVLAIRSGNFEGVKELVDDYIETNSVDFCAGYVLLCNVAVQCGHVEIAKFLLQEGVDANSRMKISRSTCCIYSEPLLIACELGCIEIVNFLLHLRPKQVYITSQLLQFALLISSDQGNEELVSSLLNAGVDPKGAVIAGKESVAYHKNFDPSPLILACRKGHAGVVDLLLRSGAQTNCVRLVDSYTPLHIASDTGHAEIVGQLLKHNADPNAKAVDNVTPLHLAAKRGALKVVELLLNSAACVDAKTKEGSTPLLLAAEFGRFKVGKVLLESGACVNAKDENSSSVLSFAIESRNSPLVRYILEHRPVIDDKICTSIRSVIVHDHSYSDIIDNITEHGFTLNREVLNDRDLLEAAAKKGYMNIVKLYLNGANPNSQSKYDIPLLHLAVEYGHQEIIKLLIDAGWDVNIKNELGFTPICYSLNLCESLCVEIIQLLLCNGADIQQTLLLHGAINSKYEEVFRVLIENGANVNELDEDGNTPLHATILKNSLFANHQMNEAEADLTETFGGKITKLLLSRNADPNVLNESGFGAIHLAAYYGIREAVQILLDHGADVNSRSEDNLTPLHLVPYQADLERVEICQIFLENGADINAVDSHSRSPLHLTVSQAYLFFVDRLRPSDERDSYQTVSQDAKEMIVELLLSNDADVNYKTTDGYTALHFAAQIYGGERVVVILLQHGADVNCLAGEDDWTPLHLACEGGDAEIVEILLSKGANAEARQRNGMEPLHLAVEVGLPDTIRVLLEFNADVDAYGASNETPLHWAVKKKFVEAVSALLENGCDVNLKNDSGKTAFELAILQAQHAQNPDNNDGNDDNDDNEDDDFGFGLPFSEDDLILRYFKKYLVRLKVAGLHVREELLQLIELNAELVDYQKNCEVEVDRIKCRTLLDMYMLHSIFVKRNNPRHMLNEDLVNILEAFDFSDYPIYGILLRSTFKKSKERIKLLDSGREWLRILMKTSNTLNMEKFPLLPVLAAEEILSNLSQRDLKNLIRCGENLKSQFLQ